MFLEVPEDSLNNGVVSALDILLLSSLCLIYTPNKGLETVTDILWD